MRRFTILAACAALSLSAPVAATTSTVADPALRQILSYPFIGSLVAARKADRVAWVRTVNGVRNIWVAGGADKSARQITRYTLDEGQELTNLAFSPASTMSGAAIMTPTGRATAGSIPIPAAARNSRR